MLADVGRYLLTAGIAATLACCDTPLSNVTDRRPPFGHRASQAVVIVGSRTPTGPVLNPQLLRHTMQRMARQGRGDDGLARFGEPGVLVLVSLSDGPKHGYAITTDVLEQTGVRLGPGTLYGSLSKLVERGLIEPVQSDDRRRPYRITGAGRAALAHQLASWERIVTTGQVRLGGLS